MAKKSRRRAAKVSRQVVEYLLLGPDDDRRQLQDSPVLGDVWVAYAEDANALQDLLVTPYLSRPAGGVARAIAKRMNVFGEKRHSSTDYANIAFLQGVVAARLYFDEVMRVVLPITSWWLDKGSDSRFGTGVSAGNFQEMIDRVFLLPPNERRDGHQTMPDAIDRFVTLTGLIMWARRAKQELNLPRNGNLLSIVKNSDRKAIAECAAAMFQDILKQRRALQNDDPLVWQISLNRKVSPALSKSVPAVKADAAKTLFSVKCNEIAWAILDSGIAADHSAFLDSSVATERASHRIKETFDFRNIRQIISLDNVDEKTRADRLKELTQGVKLTENQKRQGLDALKILAEDVDEGRPIHWDLVKQFIQIDPRTPTSSPHGTHVAGILGANGLNGTPAGLCPDIRLYDFRILSKTIDDTEFAVIAALQYVRFLNARSNFRPIHGVNLSLSIPHDVRNYACGLTPVCVECERLVESGVCVVAAAGNRGYQRFETKDGGYEGYTAFSLTDPGNADGVITVGSTHRNWPHTYGVSFFSSRGPTGDGRLKPDLVAPGERIKSALPNREWGELDGTSMAAPHVSGAAAMLMARYPELIGRPRRIKQILCDSATDLGRERSFQGHGMLDVLRAFQSI
jgi:hypothetical protein